MLAFILKEAWPSFAHNGLRWFGPGGNVDHQLAAIYNSGENLTKPEYTFHAWPLIWSTILTTVGQRRASRWSARCSSPCSWSSSRRRRCKRVLEPVVRLLASIPSVVYGLVGVLVLVPFIDDHLISQQREGIGHAR